MVVVVAGPHHGSRRDPHPVPSRDRHRADDPRRRRHQAADDGRRREAEPDRGRQHDVHVRQSQRDAPSTHHTQYFEIIGAWAIYHDGWIATVDPSNAPWLVLSNKFIPDRWETAKWHLYHVTPDADWTEYTDVQAQYPDKLKELQALFVSEGEKNNVFPIDNAPGFFDPRPSLIGDAFEGDVPSGYRRPQSGRYAEHPQSRLRDHGRRRSCRKAERTASSSPTAAGSAATRCSVTTASLRSRTTSSGSRRPAGRARRRSRPGRHSITFEFAYAGPGFGKGGTGTLMLDGKTVATNKMAHSTPFTFPWFEGLDVGADYSTAGRSQLYGAEQVHGHGRVGNVQVQPDADLAVADAGLHGRPVRRGHGYPVT